MLAFGRIEVQMKHPAIVVVDGSEDANEVILLDCAERTLPTLDKVFEWSFKEYIEKLAQSATTCPAYL
jgi:hypothetical protein